MKLLKYISWIFLIPLDWISMCLAVLLAPFVVPFYNEKKGHLPYIFRWMETFDNSIDGDGGHIERWQGKPRYFQRVAWLWRNKAYNFAYYALGREVTKTYSKGRSDVESDKNHTGQLLMWNDNAWGYFCYYPLAFGFYLRVYCGWKLKGPANGSKDKRAMLAFHINPFRRK
ncbi:hypothetical protein AVV44_gp267 [Cronobacter phage S13]|jgi:hypothetical protein|uniref:Uncharacterized protein n=1 Tax=Cronobacter phage LPCS28 TaxID=2924885 RepID=A0AAE9G9D6_9CAUD|nr:hypothetical protein AVV44_gp267 [Cronobacter phage S13]YP_010665755.1 hypothetical protein PQB73_gp269 [Cronobacter phage LPCS28]AIA64972.1 hypothetical protein S13_173 [Cronobacter phage S13]UNY46944.1 hypothetical protein EHEKIMEA_00040 [Cronobacter phage LPCS28]